MIAKCLCCEKNIEVGEHGELYDAGYLSVSFGYGSCHDQCDGYFGDRNALDPIGELLSCNEVEAYICDDCFGKKYKLMNGFDVSTKRERTHKIGNVND